MGCPSRDVHPPVGVAGEYDAEFFVDGPPVDYTALDTRCDPPLAP